MLLPVTAIKFKMEEAYEKFAGFALRGLIKPQASLVPAGRIFTGNRLDIPD